jgi:hypothetical protein
MKTKGTCLQQFATSCKESEVLAPGVHRLNIEDTEAAGDREIVQGRGDQYWAAGINRQRQGRTEPG